MEIWREIPEFEGYYEASNLGNIRAMTRRIWRPDTRRTGGGCFHEMKGRILKKRVPNENSTCRYETITLKAKALGIQEKTLSVHRCVWAAFNGPIPEGHEINHKNKQKLDNSLENLECLSIIAHRKVTSESLMGGGVEWLEATKHRSSRDMNLLLKQYFDAGYAAALEDVKKLQIS